MNDLVHLSRVRRDKDYWRKETEMTINEILLFAKILAFASGDRTVTVTDLDKKMATEALKRMADQRYDWTDQQREQYKMLVDVVGEKNP